MFEGVLDNGQDTIFLGEGSKLSQMMDTLGEMVEEQEKPSEPIVTGEMVESATIEVLEEANRELTAEEIVTDTEAPREEKQTSSLSSGQSKTQVPSTPNELIAQGTAFLSGLAATLKSPEATEQLVNSLVETDAETGQTTLKIPVPDKQTVRNLLDIVGKLFG